MDIDLSNKFISYSASNMLLIFSYTFIYIKLQAYFLDINQVRYFILVSPLILAAIFYTDQRIIFYSPKKFIIYHKFSISQDIVFLIHGIILFFAFYLSLSMLKYFYENEIINFRPYIVLMNNWIYFLSFIVIIVTIILVARRRFNLYSYIALYFLMEWALFLRTIEAVKHNSNIDIFFDTYTKLLLINILIWLVVFGFTKILKRIEISHDNHAPPDTS